MGLLGLGPLLFWSAKSKLVLTAIFNTVSMEEFERISNDEVAYNAWNILQTVYEGLKTVKINKL